MQELGLLAVVICSIMVGFFTLIALGVGVVVFLYVRTDPIKDQRNKKYHRKINIKISAKKSTESLQPVVSSVHQNIPPTNIFHINPKSIVNSDRCKHISNVEEIVGNCNSHAVGNGNHHNSNKNNDNNNGNNGENNNNIDKSTKHQNIRSTHKSKKQIRKTKPTFVKYQKPKYTPIRLIRLNATKKSVPVKDNIMEQEVKNNIMEQDVKDNIMEQELKENNIEQSSNIISNDIPENHENDIRDILDV